ncbi:MAG: elongation factor 4, partial [Candidatus Omnitrophica bacterium]|nr:elongation factor 4 [Candidatus Omnitrophota bacterium]
MTDQSYIRNFCIIAHIDHGKSTLADRILEMTGAIEKRDFRDQVLDDMDLERERGITIKASAVSLTYHASDGKAYLLNLIDTPGHVDFTFEVSKSLAACEGALLLVDAAQGVEAQTVANLYQAIERGLTIIPVINKIDLAHADTEKVKRQIGEILHLGGKEAILASAKERIGIDAVLERIVREVPPPKGDVHAPLQALIFDSSFDLYKGVVVYVKVANGKIGPHMQIQMMAQGTTYEVYEVGVFRPRPTPVKELVCGEVGYLTANIKTAKEVAIGDTVTSALHPAVTLLPGYRRMQPMVFSGIYPVNSKDFPALKEAIEKIHLSDASFVYEPESSAALGPGFRAGFLGLLHMEIIQERLEREYDLNLFVTTPSVVYEVRKKDGTVIRIDNPTRFPQETEEVREPYIRAMVLVPQGSIGEIMTLATERRGRYISSEYLDEDKVKLFFEMPLAEVIVDFYDRLKSATRGYGSLDYEVTGTLPSDVVKLDILLNGEPCEALSVIVHRSKAYSKGRSLVLKLKELIPRHQFKVQIQAAIGSKIIASESLSPMKKAVTAKCYGGDITRKRKLWEKQKVGKKRLKQFGRVEIPQEAFLEAL